MIRIKFEADINNLNITGAVINAFPNAAVKTINNTAFEVRKSIQQSMPSQLDRPTPQVIRSIQVTKKANPNSISAEVGPMNKDGDFNRRLQILLKLNVFGGVSKPSAFKRRTLSVPTKLPSIMPEMMTQFGGMKRGAIQKIKKKKGVFTVRKQNKDIIFIRKGKTIAPLIAFKNETKYTKQQFKFFETAISTAKAKLPIFIQKDIKAAMAAMSSKPTAPKYKTRSTHGSSKNRGPSINIILGDRRRGSGARVPD